MHNFGRTYTSGVCGLTPLSVLVLMAIVLFSPSGTAYGQNSETVNSDENLANLGVLAFRGPQFAIARWQPLADYLTDTIPGWRFNLVPVTLESAIDQIENKRIDFIITNPGHYVVLSERFGLSAISTRERFDPSSAEGLLEYGSAIFVHSESRISTLSELHGRTIAAVSPEAFGGFQIAWNEMLQQGVDVFRDIRAIRYMGFPQDEIVTAVLKREVDAGVVRSGLLELLAGEGAIDPDRIRVLNANAQIDYPHQVSSTLYPEWPFAALAGVNKALKENVLRALLNTQQSQVIESYRLSDAWSVPLTYNKVRRLVQTYTNRNQNSGWSMGETANTVIAFAVLLGIAIVGIWISLRRPDGGTYPSPPAGIDDDLAVETELTEMRTRFESLTPREHEVLAMICNGYQTKSIADELGVSPKTVEFHRTNLLHKTGSGTSAHMVQIATRLELDQGFSLGRK